MAVSGSVPEASASLWSGESNLVVLFVGSAISFSDRILRIVGQEFDGISFERVCGFEEALHKVKHHGTEVCVIVFDESHATAALRMLSQNPDSFGRAKLAFAYHNSLNTVALFRACQTRQPPVRIDFLPMNVSLDVWFAILRLLISGGNYLPPEIFDLVSADNPPRTNSVSANSPLTPREEQVLGLVAAGGQNKTIAAELELSEHTVKLHIHHIIRKLGLNNRTAAAVWYNENNGA